MKIQKNKALSQMSTDAQIKRYFHRVLKLRAQNEEFPVNLDEIWSLGYQRKEEAVRALKKINIFIEDVDYKILRQKAENSKGGRPKTMYMLTTECMEYFVVRRNRLVFEVYRKIFHEVVGQYMNKFYQRKLSNNITLQIGIEPLTPEEQEDIDTLAILKALQQKLLGMNLKNEKSILTKRMIRLAAKINDNEKRNQIISELTYSI